MASEIGRHPAPLFALIIGINDYANCQKLSGAVADAQAIQQYLTERLQVPQDHISTLYDSEASREAIVKGFQKLQHDTRINKGDPIVIFYAGHGGELAAPLAWRRSDNKIQCLLPQDYDAKDTKPIPDRTIGVLLEDMAKAKGDNITVIFDCCHSASGTRDPRYVLRTVPLHVDIPKTIDFQIWGNRIGLISTGFEYFGLRSHVLLAACGEKESAYEFEGRGQFTKALLETLEKHATDELTYTEIFERVHLESPHKQTPHCEGLNRRRVLFDTRVPAGRHVWHPVQVETGKYLIGAGSSHGVARGVEFTLYNDRRLRLGTVLVDGDFSIGDFETTITTPVNFAGVSFAKVTRVGTVPLYLGSCSTLEETLLRLDEEGANATKFRIAGEVEEARLQVTMENNLAVFKVLDQRARNLGLTELPYKVALDNLGHVLDAAAHYFWYLDLENKNSRLGANSEITVNFYLLRRDYDDYGVPLLLPVEPGFCQKDPNSGSSVIDFVVNPVGRYGIEVKNNTKRDLYLNAFLFNNSSLSIAPCYTLPSSGGEPTLKQNDTFTIGYGSGGTSPFSYTLEEGQDIDVGYLKIFFATLPIDLSDIEQMSPFYKNHPPPRSGFREGNHKTVPRARDIWFTILIPVVQRRRKTDGIQN